VKCSRNLGSRHQPDLPHPNRHPTYPKLLYNLTFTKESILGPKTSVVIVDVIFSLNARPHWVPIHRRHGVDLELPKPLHHHQNDCVSRLRPPALQFGLQLMHIGHNYISNMNTQLSPPRLSLSPGPLLAEASPQETPPPTPMPLPPEAIYSSKVELYTSIQAFAAQHSYAFYVRRSTKINNGLRSKITYNCDRYGLPLPENHPQNYLQARKRQTTTRKTGCQFSVLAVECSNTQWELRHRPGIEYSQHNHPPSDLISSHPAHRKLAQAEINQARSLHNAGTLSNILCPRRGLIYT
jgi:hypothetical protein